MTGAASRYRVLRRLGQGGMAEVFEAERVGELGFVRKVALKQLRPDALRDPMAAQRFIDETRIASQLHHAHIVAVLDVGVLDDRPFQVLELVDGLDADELVRRAGGALPPELALMLAHAVAHALDHAHTATGGDGRSLGIVHRDVKPPNILIAWSGDVKLADFGIAVAHDRVAHTETGLVAGTRGFIAPEQRTRGQLDGRSDVFALGVTLHALCTGRSPLSDLEAEVRLLGGEPIALDPALPDDVRALIARAVAPDRRARPTAAGFAAAIGDVLAARGARDARSTLQAFLATLRRPPRAAGALDLLLGVELVPVDAPGPVQLYATEVPRAPPEPPAPRPPAPPAVVPPAPHRRSRPLVIAGAGVALAVAAAVAILRPTDDATHAAPIAAAPRDSASAAPAAPAPGSAALASTTPRDAGGAELTDTGIPDAVAASVPVAAAPHPGAPRHHPTATPAPGASPAAAVDPAARGYIQVVGEDLLRARVLVDGVAVGYVPNRFAVTLGHHRVEVERPDGVRLPPRELDVTSFHTAQRPARPTW
ncbi:MAG TPA: serine/threonine-protein kinase [Kofleriaceae bacterium]|jgi:tRNA A-37 threonylcarbamoyl transferase component Bud32|nr:serine/threonine-protein kinase [Kofleriaceae bacterium]